MVVPSSSVFVVTVSCGAVVGIPSSYGVEMSSVVVASGSVVGSLTTPKTFLKERKDILLSFTDSTRTSCKAKQMDYANQLPDKS